MSAPEDRSARPRRRDAGFKDFVLEQLEGLGEVRAQAMFGGWGLYCGETFFSIVWGGRLFFRTNDESRPRYEARGMRPFRPNPRQELQRYYEVPTDVLEDPTELARWAREAMRRRSDPPSGSRRGEKSSGQGGRKSGREQS